MKVFYILLLISFLTKGNYSLLKQKNKPISLIVLKDQDQKAYAKSIFKELDNYRWMKGIEPEIEWSSRLVQSAQKELNIIVQRGSFDDHENFKKVQKKIRNKFFTEITMKIDTTGRTPSKKLFGITALEALLQKYRYYIVEEYTHCGIAVKPFKYNKQAYAVVIHLIKS